MGSLAASAIRPETYARLLSAIWKGDKAVPTAATTAIAALVHRKARQRQTASFVLLAALAAYVFITPVLGLLLSRFVIAIGAGACLLLQSAEFSMSYRVRHGLYGTTEYEARQIIAFILNHADRSDLEGGLGAADIQLNAEAEELIQSNWGMVTS